MKYKYFILFVFCSILSVFAQQGEHNCSISYPEFIPQNSSFNFSIITTKAFPDAGKLKLYFSLESKIEIRSVEMRSPQKVTRIPLTNIFIDEYNTNGFRAVINLSDTSLSEDNYFQILLNLRSNFSNNANIKFFGEFTLKDSVLGYLSTSDNSLQVPGDKTIAAKFEFYKPQENAGNAMLIEPESYFTLPLHDMQFNKLLSEFWISFNNADINFLNVKNEISSKNEFVLNLNSFQMLSVNSKSSTISYINPVFIGLGSWYHIDILFSDEDKNIVLYCNDKLFAKIKVDDFSKPQDYGLIFLNESTDKSFELDLLRLLDLNNSIELAFSNKNYSNFISDSSRVLFQTGFESDDQLYKLETSSGAEFNNVQIINSDAPIFARAPELNINVLNNSYELEWSGGDYKQAQSYTLEKAANNSEFVSVSTVQAENIADNEYSVLDEQNPDNDIVFYRVKQINKDGSVVYSSVVKVGQGLTEPFILEQNYPNPFNPRTVINVELLEDSDISLTIYNLEGREIIQLFKGFLGKGMHKFSFDGTSLPSGIYLYKVSTPDYSQIKKMVLTK
jgi:Secretion system C-terminal sorting domain